METVIEQTFGASTKASDLLKISVFEDCTFSDCNLEGIDLSGKEFQDCTFNVCNLSLAKLSRTALRGVQFNRCKLIGLRFDQCNAFLLDINFEESKLDHSSFYGLKIKRIRYRHCSLREVDFTSADISDGTIEGCDLQDAVFERSNLERLDLRESVNIRIDPEINNLYQAKISLSSLGGLLEKHQLKIY
ncbi:MAG: pentapeptide repeat-containing protein [Sphingobacteriales bacterium]|nr:MAG: pentapeptide repeat-containing protein [Sphingobacteriales bacterium]